MGTIGTMGSMSAREIYENFVGGAQRGRRVDAFREAALSAVRPVPAEPTTVDVLGTVLGAPNMRDSVRTYLDTAQHNVDVYAAYHRSRTTPIARPTTTGRHARPTPVLRTVATVSSPPATAPGQFVPPPARGANPWTPPPCAPESAGERTIAMAVPVVAAETALDDTGPFGVDARVTPPVLGV